MKSPWTILVIGALAFGMIALAMLYTLNKVQEGPTGNRIRLAHEIKERFHFDTVSVDRRLVGEHETLIVIYSTERELQSNADACTEEMKAVALLTWEKCEEKDRKEVDRAHILRQEKRGSSPMIQTEYRMTNPEIKKFFDSDHD